MKQDLTLEQKLELEKFRRGTARISKQQAVDLLIQATRLRMIKDNVIRGLKR